MSSPVLHVTGHREAAAVSVRKQKGSLLRKHWLTAAFVFGLAGVVGYIGSEFYKAEAKLTTARAARVQLEEQLADARQHNSQLKANLAKVTDDSYMEVLAKSMGFVYPQETAYQLSGK